MLLVADVGNTNVVFALFDLHADGTHTTRARWRIATDPRRTGDEYAVWLMQLLQIRGVKREEIDQIIVSTVVPRAMHNIEVLAKHYFQIDPIVAGEGRASYHIDIDVPDPRSLGADRAVNAVAAHAKYPGDLIVIDFGTATTLDSIDFNGAYKGGIIAPGIATHFDRGGFETRPHREHREPTWPKHQSHPPNQPVPITLAPSQHPARTVPVTLIVPQSS